MSPAEVEVRRRGSPVRASLVVASAASGTAFLLVAAMVVTAPGWLVTADLHVSQRAVGFTFTHSWCADLAHVATWFGNPLTVTLLTTAVCLALLVRRRVLLAVWLGLAVAGGSLLNTAVKVSVERVRPASEGLIASAHGYSFPSGHTDGATVTYVAVVLVVAWQVWRPGSAARRASTVAVTLLVASVGTSRVLLGVHWPSDVLGGWLLGSAWVCGATVVLLAVSARRPDHRAALARAHPK